MNAERETFTTIAARLLDPATPLEREGLGESLLALQRLFGELTGIRGEPIDGPSPRLFLHTGMLLPYQSAATCMLDPLRTTKYIRALDAAVRAAREKFPGETIHVLYAGTGPYAPLALPLVTRYGPEEVQFTCLEIHPEAVQALVRLAEALGLAAYIKRIVQTDAAGYVHDDPQPFHIVVSECMQKALTRECQVAITCNLSRQLHPEGFFIPDTVTVSACMSNPQREFEQMLAPETLAARVHLGEVFRLDRRTHERLPADRPLENAVFACPDLPMPDPFPDDTNFLLLTRVELFDDIVLTDFESGLTVPYVVYNLLGLREIEALKCEYRVCSQPGFYFEKIPEPNRNLMGQPTVYPAHGAGAHL